MHEIMHEILTFNGVSREEVQPFLNIDLAMINADQSYSPPANANAVQINVSRTGEKRFAYEIQFGHEEGSTFVPIGEPKKYETEPYSGYL